MPFAGYTNFDDCVSKNSDKSDPDAYCGSIKHQVEETDKRFLSRETDPNLMTPKKQMTEPVTNQSPAGEQNEDEDKDKKREEQQGQATEKDEDEKWNFEKPKEEAEEQDEEIVSDTVADNTGKDDEERGDDSPDHEEAKEQEEVPEQFKDVPDKPEKTEDEPEEEKVEYEGENYKLLKISESAIKGNVIEYDNKFYTPLKLKEKTGESDIDYEGTVYRARTNTLIEYNGKIYQNEADNPHTDAQQDQAEPDDKKDQAKPAEEDVSISGPPAGTEPTVIEDELKKTGENIVIKTRKGYKRLQVYEADTTTSKLENLKNRGLSKKEKEDKKDKESKKKA